MKIIKDFEQKKCNFFFIKYNHAKGAVLSLFYGENFEV